MIKSHLIRPFARYISRQIKQGAARPLEAQDRLFHNLLRIGRRTAFGRDHGFEQIRRYDDFRRQVPLRDYEALKPYIERIKQGEQDVLWTGRPLFFAKTSGTTSGVKYIPITRESVPNHVNTARNALFHYAVETGNYRFFDGKLIFLSGSPALDEVAGIKTGRLSGIVNHWVPAWLRANQLPSYNTNCIDEWEEKLERIVDETLGADMRLISGIPPWVQMYYERLLARTGQSAVSKLFPNYSVFVYGGVNFEPYRDKLEELVGRKIDSVETYPASEGFIAFQDSQRERGLLLNTDSGIFFEFIPVEEVFNEQPRRFSLREVEIGVNYAVVVNNNAGLWAYDLGDTVEFVSLQPYRILVTGRVKHFISAFGEHVIGKEVEAALLEAVHATPGVQVTEFTVAPQVNPPGGGLPFHEWFIAFDQAPADLEAFSARLDRAMVHQNIYYRDLIEGGILRPLVVRPLPAGAFRDYMKSEGKLGGQNKVPRLSNDRKIAEKL